MLDLILVNVWHSAVWSYQGLTKHKQGLIPFYCFTWINYEADVSTTSTVSLTPLWSCLQIFWLKERMRWKSIKSVEWHPWTNPRNGASDHPVPTMVVAKECQLEQITSQETQQRPVFHLCNPSLVVQFSTSPERENHKGSKLRMRNVDDFMHIYIHLLDFRGLWCTGITFLCWQRSI